jgi:hypothetical protein
VTDTSRRYQRVLVCVNDEHARLPKLKIRGTGRLKLLRRTLRERPALALYVRELHLPDVWTLYQSAAIEREEIVSLVASVVMCCPYLERLVGFHVPFTNAFDRLSHALSTRPNLKEKIFLAEDSAGSSDDEDDDLDAYYVAACDPTERFLELNSNHASLSTLILHSTMLNFRAIIGTTRQFANLQKLSISSLTESSFTNLTLNSLPPNLVFLRLEDLPGIDDKGLQRFTTSHRMRSIKTLILIDLEISNLATISRMLSTQSASLEAFSLAQYRAPSLSSRSFVPEFCSRTLRYIHWEIRSDAEPLPILPSFSIPTVSKQSMLLSTNLAQMNCLATSVLAQSINRGTLPSLRRIRIPHDPQGLVQALCKPLATALLPCDMAMLNSMLCVCRLDDLWISNGAQPPQEKARDSVIGEPLSPRTDSAIDLLTPSNYLAQNVSAPARTRLAAQARILAARKTAYMAVRVYNPNGDLKINKAVGGFIGRLDSRVTYDLGADKGRASGVDHEGSNAWITNVEDLVGSQDAEGAQLRERLRGTCGHWIGGKLLNQSVMAEDLFRSSLGAAAGAG